MAVGQRDHSCGLPHSGDPPFEPFASKLRRPSVRPGTVRRSLLIERLARGDPHPVVWVVAPVGYGKTTLLSQWAERDGRAFAWVSLDERDNDPKILLTYVAEALNAVEAVDQQVFDGLDSSGGPVPDWAVSGLGFAFSSMNSSVALILDNVHVLYEQECWAALSVMADHVPPGSRLVLSGRDATQLRMARRRTAGRMVEIGPRDLALCHEETSSLLRNAGLPVSEDEVAELHRRTEGWPAGLYLAALYLREVGALADAAASFSGDDRFVSDYMESELLARLTPRQRLFLTRTAVLDRLCGPLCEAVLDQPGATATLRYLAPKIMLVPLDEKEEWYRYHPLFRDMLLAELRRLDPELIPVLRRRAAGWCTANGLPEEALEYSMAADDVDMAAGLAPGLVVQARQQGRVGTVDRWLGWLDERGAIGQHPTLAGLAGIISALAGRPAEAERWADTADRWQHGEASGPPDAAAEAWMAVLRALLCRDGVEQMRTDARDAVSKFVVAGIAPPPMPLIEQGVAGVLSGDIDNADAVLADAVSRAEEAGAHEALAIALSERALVAIARGEWDSAESLAQRARAVSHQASLEDTIATPLAFAVHARAAWHRGDMAAARQDLVGAQRARHKLTYALPHLAVQARIELARVHLGLGALAGARVLMREVDELLRSRPDLGNLTREARAFRARLSEEHGLDVPGASALSAAELRLLPMLASHLSFAEIAGELFLSRHTVKAQAISIYRKLGASSRSQAVVRARGLGLMPG